jgi:hypothetical protein
VRDAERRHDELCGFFATLLDGRAPEPELAAAQEGRT